MNNKIKKIADTYGFIAQGRQTMEECAELIQALNKYMRTLGAGQPVISDGKEVSLRATHDNIIEEMADVSVMLDQLTYLLDCETELSEWKRLKIERILERMKVNM